MRVALVHDDLVQWGGAERMLEALTYLFPRAPIYTSLFDSSNRELNFRFGHKKVYASFLQRIPGWRALYKMLLPLYPLAFEQFDFTNFDLVISQSTRFAKSILTKPGTVHISYIHTTPRFLWDPYDTSLKPFKALLNVLKFYDRISANRADFFLAGSQNAQKKIKNYYGKDSVVVYPFADYKRFDSEKSFNGGYFITISRLNKYKRIDLAVESCIKMGLFLKVIGTGPDLDRLQRLAKDSRKIEFLKNVDDDLLAFLLSGARALIIPGVEDFGIVSLEAQATGKPVIAYRTGGALETVIEGKTGIFFDEQTTSSLSCALTEFENKEFDAKDCKYNARKFTEESFFKNFNFAVGSALKLDSLRQGH
ncbi:glycosyltransferase [Candidatus Daviesbacteria bacterium]|nr:glycosyltransferase [Candidatus Daviesbacteria bacterium]